MSTLNERQREELSTCTATCRNLVYPSLGMIEETAEYWQKLLYLIEWDKTLDSNIKNHLEMLIKDVITCGLAVGKYAKMFRHDKSIPVPFQLKRALETDYPELFLERVEGLVKELGDIKWMTDAADFYIHYPDGTDPTDPSVQMTAQDTAELNHKKLTARLFDGTIDGQGDTTRTPID